MIYFKLYLVFLEKDKLSRFDFISVKEFLLALFLMFVSTLFVFIYIPYLLQRIMPAYKELLRSHYFNIVLLVLSSLVTFYIIYYFCCKRKQKSLKDGLFFYTKPVRTILISALIGITVPLATLPVIIKFAPHEFYAMDLAKEKGGLIYLFCAAILAPLFEEIFYRGFIFPFFQSTLNSFWAVIITSLFFGLSHFMNIGNAHILLSLFIFYGFVLTLIRYFTNSLIPPVITHFVHNAVLMIGFFVMQKIL